MNRLNRLQGLEKIKAEMSVVIPSINDHNPIKGAVTDDGSIKLTQASARIFLDPKQALQLIDYLKFLLEPNP